MRAWQPDKAFSQRESDSGSNRHPVNTQLSETLSKDAREKDRASERPRVWERVKQRKHKACKWVSLLALSLESSWIFDEEKKKSIPLLLNTRHSQGTAVWFRETLLKISTSEMNSRHYGKVPQFSNTELHRKLDGYTSATFLFFIFIETKTEREKYAHWWSDIPDFNMQWKKACRV